MGPLCLRLAAAAVLPLVGLLPLDPALAQRPRAHLVSMLKAMDAAFVCPAALPDDEARKAELDSFTRRLVAERLSYAQAAKVRQNFLDRHGCGQPAQLASIADAGIGAAQ